MELKPLTTEEIRSKYQLKEAYGDFWNNIKFRKGWAKPMFSREEVEDELDMAAEIVIRIRSFLDKKTPTFKLRLVEGSSMDYFWSLETYPHDDLDAFMNGLVHATLKDADGYTEGLTEDRVNQFIKVIKGYILTYQSDKVEEEGKQLDEDLNSHLQKITTLLKEIFPDQLKISEGRRYGMSKSQLLHLQRTLKALQVAFVELEEYKAATALAKKREEKNQVTEETMEEIRKIKADEKIRETETEPELKRQKTWEEEEKETKQEQIEPAKAHEQDQKDEPKKEAEEQKQEVKEEKQELKEEKKEEKSDISQKRDSSILKIQRVAEEVKTIESEIREIKLNAESLKLDELTQHPIESKDNVGHLQKQLLHYSDSLVKDLLSLDAIVDASEEARPLRKQQVLAIQSLLNDVDTLKEKLGKLQLELKPVAQKIEEEKKEEKEKQEQKEKKEEKEKQEQKEKKEEKEKQEQKEKKEKEKKEVKEKKEEEKKEGETEAKQIIKPIDKNEKSGKEKREAIRKSSMSDKWKALRLRPQFKVAERDNGYYLSANIPGMSKDDIRIFISSGQKGDNVTVEGLRLPSTEEETNLRKQVLNRRNPFRLYHGSDSDDDEDMLVLRHGAGRYGKFSETFHIPHDVDPSNISAKYEGGVLQIFLPRVMYDSEAIPIRDMYSRPLPTIPLSTRARGYGRDRYPVHSSPFGHEGFFDDSDFFW